MQNMFSKRRLIGNVTKGGFIECGDLKTLVFKCNSILI